jgi:hypothetical protein
MQETFFIYYQQQKLSAIPNGVHERLRKDIFITHTDLLTGVLLLTYAADS